jgi:23S rRNA (guanine745-N1)-methyltransferase
MLFDVMNALQCPVCGSRLVIAKKSVRCASGHSFDIAAQGYLNLLAGGAHTGTADTAEMVSARDAFLRAGHFSVIARQVVLAIEPHFAGPEWGDAPLLVEVGAGTGYYLAEALEAFEGAAGVALDISKYAMRRAAKAHPRIGAVVCDAWGSLPIRDGQADAVLDIFAPRNPSEFHRVLKPAGVLVVVTPTCDHLAEIVGPLGLLGVEGEKAARLERTLEPHFVPSGTEQVVERLTLSHGEVATLVGMGPSAYHVDAERLGERIASLPEPLDVTVSVSVATYAPRPDTV